MKKFYKSVSFVTRELKKEIAAKYDAQKIVEASSEKINTMGKKLYDQFRSFVMKNPDLYDNDFIERISAKKYEIDDVSIAEFKKAYRITVNISPHGRRFVMVPFLFVADPDAYRNARIRKNKFGKDSTKEDVDKHYDGKIEQLQAEVEKLKLERSQMYNADDWK